MTRRAATILASVALAGLAATAEAGNRFALEPFAPEITRAFQYAAMSDELCLTELGERGVPYELVDAPAPGVGLPIRFTGPVRGVLFVPTYRAEPDPRAPATIADCRLALAIDDAAQILASHGVVEAEYLSMYRRGGGRPGWRHPAGRAIDVATVKLGDGTVLSVRHDFYGRTGAQTCGAGAAPPRRETAGALFWRTFVCQLDGWGSFNLILTPNYNWGHRDHLHLEVRSGIRWFLTQ
ncbi:MAG: hypothetical protein HY744_18000 [Deltaproteobacteria bacterium]|nr:hypothetical protein [Deltaproteobacteria bacterium]